MKRLLKPNSIEYRSLPPQYRQVVQELVNRVADTLQDLFKADADSAAMGGMCNLTIDEIFKRSRPIMNLIIEIYPVKNVKDSKTGETLKQAFYGWRIRDVETKQLICNCSEWFPTQAEAVGNFMLVKLTLGYDRFEFDQVAV